MSMAAECKRMGHQRHSHNCQSISRMAEGVAAVTEM